MATTTGTHPLLETGLTGLAFARQATLSLLEAIPKDKLTTPASPGGNHALWVAGHLARSDDDFLTVLSGSKSPLPPKWKELFGTGSKPMASAADYPDLKEILAALSERRQALVTWLKSLDEAKLRSPLPEDWRDFAPTHAALATSIVWHEGVHAGQLTSIRKALGLKPIYG